MIEKRIKEIGVIDPLVRPRILILSDIGNEPDDQQSLIRLLTYSNEFDLEGLIATTSMWQKRKIRLDLMEKVIKAYGGSPRDNLMIHSRDYFPTEDELLSLIKKGQIKYGMNGVGDNQDSKGSDWIIHVIDKLNSRPVWISIWGGSNTLAQALWKVQNSRSKEELEEFINKIRVYAITDQDDSAPWIRKKFPNLFYIVSPFHYVPDHTRKFIVKGRLAGFIGFVKFSLKAVKNHRRATWSGISGEIWYRFKGGPDSTLITNKWLRENVRNNHGPLGRVYPKTKFAMETDTPSFLNLIRNGLRSSQNPTYGGWGGRYELYQPVGEPRAIYTDSEDTVVVGKGFGKIKGKVDGIYTSNQATIWRWREAYQHDFAARMDWASTPNYKGANHPPKVIIQGELERNVKGDETIELDASNSSDPDKNELFFHWFHYKEAGTYNGEVIIDDPSSNKINLSFKNQKKSGTVHIIVEVKDNGDPCLYRHARIIFHVNKKTRNRSHE